MKPTILKPRLAAAAAILARDPVLGRHVAPFPNRAAPADLGISCRGCGCPAFFLHAGGRVVCAQCKQTTGWLAGRLVLGRDEPPAGWDKPPKPEAS